jgi:hypothetical protein
MASDLGLLEAGAKQLLEPLGRRPGQAQRTLY